MTAQASPTDQSARLVQPLEPLVEKFNSIKTKAIIERFAGQLSGLQSPFLERSTGSKVNCMMLPFEQNLVERQRVTGGFTENVLVPQKIVLFARRGRYVGEPSFIVQALFTGQDESDYLTRPAHGTDNAQELVAQIMAQCNQPRSEMYVRPIAPPAGVAVHKKFDESKDIAPLRIYGTSIPQLKVTFG